MRIGPLAEETRALLFTRVPGPAWADPPITMLPAGPETPSPVVVTAAEFRSSTPPPPAELPVIARFPNRVDTRVPWSEISTPG